jgi:hypothetical protein
MEYSKTQKELIVFDKENINNIVGKYNSIKLKSVTNYNMVMQEMELVLNHLYFLGNNSPFLGSIIEPWEKETKNIIDLSNDENFRSFMRGILNGFIMNYKANSNSDHILQFLKNMNTVFNKYDTFTIDDRVFIFNLRNYIEFTKEETNLIGIHLDLFNSGEAYKRVCYEYKVSIFAGMFSEENINEYFENEIRTKIIDERRLHDLIYNFFIKVFHYCEVLLRVIFFEECFESIISKRFKGFYEQKNKMFYGTLNEYVITEQVENNVYIEKYIKRGLIYDYYKVLEKGFDPIPR